MRKWLIAMLTAACAATCAIGLAACDKGHDHVWAEELSHDGTSHWYACTVEGCTERNGESRHSWGDPAVITEPSCYASGSGTYVCNDCGESKVDDISPTGKHVFDENATPVPAENGAGHYIVCSTEGCTAHTDAVAHTKCGYDESEVVKAAGDYTRGTAIFHCVDCGADMGESALPAIKAPATFDLVFTRTSGLSSLETRVVVDENHEVTLYADNNASKENPSNPDTIGAAYVYTFENAKNAYGDELTLTHVNFSLYLFDEYTGAEEKISLFSTGIVPGSQYINLYNGQIRFELYGGEYLMAFRLSDAGGDTIYDDGDFDPLFEFEFRVYCIDLTTAGMSLALDGEYALPAGKEEL